MILDEIVLHDFGVYGGRQSIALTPTARDKPIILFGGLNGGGKTTLLDALQLAFFGNVAQCAGRGDLSYDEYLRRSVHHGALNPEASVEVAFRHTVDGEVQHWRLTRSWNAGANVRERFQVYRNDELDKAASEQWSAQVEDFIPQRIAPLFLFDGEKVEGYADLNEAPALIRTAIQNLLGLDIVERLGSDLHSLERRRKGELAAPAEAEALAGLRDQIQRLVSERGGHVRERAAAANDIDRMRRTTEELEQRYEREGGALFEDRGRLEAELAVSERGHEAVRRSLRELAAGALPLALVTPLLSAVAAQASAEEEARRSAQTADAIADEMSTLLALPAMHGISADVRVEVERHLNARRMQLERTADQPRYLQLEEVTRAALGGLLTGGLHETQGQARELLGQEKGLRTAIGHIRTLLSAVPNQSAVADLIAQRETARDALRFAEFEQTRRDNEIARLDRELETARERETRLLETTAREQFEREDVTRLLTHSTKVRATLERFREAVVHRHVARIEGFVLDSFRQLVRKTSLVTSLRIDPVSFALDLQGSGGQRLTAERLSAGERQLLAIAILWGLARASGRPLPMVIDTPLGRLDAEHRTRLVTHYFPHASHQVILLSTDQEITGTHYQALRPAVGRDYRLRYDQQAHRTVVETGYFEEAA
jgi:DNA sulfur modification protein DndD